MFRDSPTMILPTRATFRRRAAPVFRGAGVAGSTIILSILSMLSILSLTAPFGCFSLKELPCAFSCADPQHLCPANYTCGDDQLCHRIGATAVCPLIPPDAGADVDLGTTSSD